MGLPAKEINLVKHCIFLQTHPLPSSAIKTLTVKQISELKNIFHRIVLFMYVHAEMQMERMRKINIDDLQKESNDSLLPIKAMFLHCEVIHHMLKNLM